MSSPDHWSEFVHDSISNPYPHTDFITPVSKEHLQIDESTFLAEKYNIDLQPGRDFLPSQLNDLLGR